MPADTLISLLRGLDAETARAAIARIAAAVDLSALLSAIESGTRGYRT